MSNASNISLFKPIMIKIWNDNNFVSRFVTATNMILVWVCVKQKMVKDNDNSSILSVLKKKIVLQDTNAEM